VDNFFDIILETQTIFVYLSMRKSQTHTQTGHKVAGSRLDARFDAHIDFQIECLKLAKRQRCIPDDLLNYRDMENQYMADKISDDTFDSFVSSSWHWVTTKKVPACFE
jgi:hypothetical protein